MPNSASDNSTISLPRWRAEHLRFYHRRFPGSRQRLKIRVTAKNIKGLIERGYLRPHESEDKKAISQALRLFLWDSLKAAPRRFRHQGAKRTGEPNSQTSR